ncbi:phosphopantetheine-binding protein [Myxococcota bacterium]|nr:phosphopantetheine-binding protein [Myxococcota bacterium]
MAGIEDLRNEVKRMLVEALNLEGVDPASIGDGAPLFGEGEGLGLDSLDALQLAVAVEDRFGIPIGDSDVGKEAFRSVDDLARFIARHTPER